VYQIAGKDVIFTWLEHEPNLECRESFLEWLAGLATDPITDRAIRLPGVLAPVYVEIVPLGRRRGAKHAVVRFLVSDQFHAVRILAIAPLP
jgi:hypothetical protein